MKMGMVNDLDRIRLATEPGEIIGSKGFREQIAEMLGRCVEKSGHGGDRKSEAFLQR